MLCPHCHQWRGLSPIAPQTGVGTARGWSYCSLCNRFWQATELLPDTSEPDLAGVGRVPAAA